MPLPLAVALTGAFTGALGLAAAATAAAQTLRYGGEAGAGQAYTRIQEDHVRQIVDGSEQKVDIRSDWRFSIRIAAENSESLTIEIVHDSISVTGSPSGDADFAGLYGKPVVVVLGRRGEVRSIDLPESLPVPAARLGLETTYRTFFPVLPMEPISPGTTWADTTRVSSDQNGLDINVERVNRYTAHGPAPYAGGEALRIDYVTAIELDGGGSQQGAAVSLSGSGSGNGSFYFDVEGGRYLGGSETTEVKMDAFVASGGQNILIPIVTTRTETVALTD
ncbi:MAG TPA: hypothetical protein VM737_07300 [Gemmatimonadota bacterium]|nr:hypothetical protein [Gemmatimonadota bacterium]